MSETKPMEEFKWRIPNFLSLSFNRSDFICSSSPFMFAGSYWRMYICEVDKHGYSYSVFVEKGGFSSEVACSLSLKQADGILFGTVTLNGTSDCMFRDFINVSTLRERSSELLPENMLTIVCTVEMGKRSKQKRLLADDADEESSLNKKQAISTLEQKQLEEIKSITEGLKSCLDSLEFSDVTLKVRDKVFNAHKAILLASSPVFTLLFTHEIFERHMRLSKGKEEIHIYDCDPLSFHELLQYIYSGKIGNISFEQAFELYKTADKYEFPNLKKFCAEQMELNFEAENVLDAIALADKYNDMSLIEAGQKYFNNNFSKLVGTPPFLNMMRDDHILLNSLLIRLAKEVKVMEESEEIE